MHDDLQYAVAQVLTEVTGSPLWEGEASALAVKQALGEGAVASPLALVEAAAREGLLSAVRAVMDVKHGGPGPHDGTGTPQAVHGGPLTGDWGVDLGRLIGLPDDLLPDPAPSAPGGMHFDDPDAKVIEGETDFYFNMVEDLIPAPEEHTFDLSPLQGIVNDEGHPLYETASKAVYLIAAPMDGDYGEGGLDGVVEAWDEFIDVIERIDEDDLLLDVDLDALDPNERDGLENALNDIKEEVWAALEDLRDASNEHHAYEIEASYFDPEDASRWATHNRWSITKAAYDADTDVDTLLSNAAVASEMKHATASGLQGALTDEHGRVLSAGYHFLDGPAYGPGAGGAAYAGASAAVAAWAQSSNDEHAPSLSAQEMAVEEFRLGRHSRWNTPTVMAHGWNRIEQAGPEEFREAQRALLRAMYDRTQEHFRKKGITHVRLTRGQRDWDGLDRPMSSWSMNEDTARGFTGGGADIEIDHDDPSSARIDPGGDRVIRHKTFPVEQVLCFPGTGFGCLNEYEVVVLATLPDAVEDPEDQLRIEGSEEWKHARHNQMDHGNRLVPEADWEWPETLDQDTLVDLLRSAWGEYDGETLEAVLTTVKVKDLPGRWDAPFGRDPYPKTDYFDALTRDVENAPPLMLVESTGRGGVAYNDQYAIIDGIHRRNAAERAGVETLRAYVIQRPTEAKHDGPGPHSTGSPQAVHAGARRVLEPFEATEVMELWFEGIGPEAAKAQVMRRMASDLRERGVTVEDVEHALFTVERAYPGDLPDVSDDVTERFSAWVVAAWAGSSNKTPFSAAMQKVAMDHWGITGGEYDPISARQEFDERTRGVLSAVLDVQYARTQQQLSEMGIEDVTLYRGMTMAPGGQGGRMNPLSSWSTMPETAESFAATDISGPMLDTTRVPGDTEVYPPREDFLDEMAEWNAWADAEPETYYAGDDPEEEADLAQAYDDWWDDRPFEAVPSPEVVYEQDVPRARLLSTALTGFGCLGESEVVVLSGVPTRNGWNQSAVQVPLTEGKHAGPGPHPGTGTPQSVHSTGPSLGPAMKHLTKMLSDPDWRAARRIHNLPEAAFTDADHAERSRLIALGRKDLFLDAMALAETRAYKEFFDRPDTPNVRVERVQVSVDKADGYGGTRREWEDRVHVWPDEKGTRLARIPTRGKHYGLHAIWDDEEKRIVAWSTDPYTYDHEFETNPAKAARNAHLLDTEERFDALHKVPAHQDLTEYVADLWEAREEAEKADDAEALQHVDTLLRLSGAVQRDEDTHGRRDTALTRIMEGGAAAERYVAMRRQSPRPEDELEDLLVLRPRYDEGSILRELARQGEHAADLLADDTDLPDPEAPVLYRYEDGSASALKAHVAKEIARGLDAGDIRRIDQYGTYLYGRRDDPNEGIDSERGREKVTSDLVGNWAASSNDHNAQGLYLQEAAAEEFGLEGTAGWHTPPEGGAGSKHIVNPDLLKEGQRKVLRQMYERTQEWFAENGITHVRAHRGQEPSAGWEGTLRPLSAWSVYRYVAVDFSSVTGHDKEANFDLDEGQAPSLSHGRTTGFVVSGTFPVSRILCTPMTGLGCLSEGEVVVLGGPIEDVLKPLGDGEVKHLPGQHPQETHGNWARRGKVVYLRDLRGRLSKYADDHVFRFPQKVTLPDDYGLLAPEGDTDETREVREAVRASFRRLVGKAMGGEATENESALLAAAHRFGPAILHGEAEETWADAPEADVPWGREIEFDEVTRPDDPMHWVVLSTMRSHEGEPDPVGVLAERSGLDEAVVSRHLRAWAGGTGSYEARVMQDAARAEFDLPGAAETYPVAAPDEDVQQARTLLRAMYEHTQEQFEPGERLVLYRGIREALAETGKPHRTRPLESWSPDEDDAEFFALGHENGEDRGEESVIMEGALMRATVPAERVLSLPWTGLGNGAELAEVVVLGEEIVPDGIAGADQFRGRGQTAYQFKHGGPGPHAGTGSPQAVHATGGVGYSGTRKRLSDLLVSEDTRTRDIASRLWQPFTEGVPETAVAHTDLNLDWLGEHAPMRPGPDVATTAARGRAYLRQLPTYEESDEAHEQGVTVLRDGSLLNGAIQIGSARSIPTRVSEYRGKDVAVQMHNHPRDDTSLSIGDVMVGLYSGADRVEAVTRAGEFALDTDHDALPVGFRGKVNATAKGLEALTREAYQQGLLTEDQARYGSGVALIRVLVESRPDAFSYTLTGDAKHVEDEMWPDYVFEVFRGRALEVLA